MEDRKLSPPSLIDVKINPHSIDISIEKRAASPLPFTIVLSLNKFGGYDAMLSFVPQGIQSAIASLPPAMQSRLLGELLDKPSASE